jgi:hypothetical protein
LYVSSNLFFWNFSCLISWKCLVPCILRVSLCRECVDPSLSNMKLSPFCV